MKTLLLILAGLFFTLSSIAKPLNSSDSLRIKAWNFILCGKGDLQDLKRLNNSESNGSEKFPCELKVLKTFVESFNFNKMKENTSLNYTSDSKTHVKSFCEPGRQYAFYLFRNSQVGTLQNENRTGVSSKGKINFKIPEGTYRADWIDPLLGNIIRTDYFSVKRDKHSLNTPSYYMDLALKIIRIL